jgi:hypothetical protein
MNRHKISKSIAIGTGFGCTTMTSLLMRIYVAKNHRILAKVVIAGEKR